MAIVAPLHCGRLEVRLAHRKMRTVQRRTPAAGVFAVAGFEEIFHNQVLTSAALAGFSAQLAKPFTSAVAGKGFNWKLMFKSGGTPSAHAASMVAAATVLGMERGFSDSLFGFSLVIAGIVMYDAQGVRREVGKHAEVLNTMALTAISSKESIPSPRSLVEASTVKSASSLDVEQELPFSRSTKFFQTAQTLPSMKDGEVSIQEIGSEEGWQRIPLKESIGHTKAQVLAGAVFGATVSIISHAIGLN